MNEMIERIANDLMKIGYDESEGLKIYYKFAKAAIQAMHEPTVEMINAAIRYGVDFDMGINYDIYKEMYQKMIDKALSDV